LYDLLISRHSSLVGGRHWTDSCSTQARLIWPALLILIIWRVNPSYDHAIRAVLGVAVTRSAPRSCLFTQDNYRLYGFSLCNVNHPGTDGVGADPLREFGTAKGLPHDNGCKKVTRGNPITCVTFKIRPPSLGSSDRRRDILGVNLITLERVCRNSPHPGGHCYILLRRRSTRQVLTWSRMAV